MAFTEEVVNQHTRCDRSIERLRAADHRELESVGRTRRDFGADAAAFAANDQHKALRKSLEGTGIEILAEEYSDSDRTQAQTIMENFLTTYPDIDLVFTTSDDFGYGALNAIKAAGKAGDIKIVSIDGQPEVLQAIKDGEWSSTIYQTPAMMAEKVVEVANRVLAGEKIEEYNQNTDYYLVTEDNVDEYLNR